MNIKIKMKKIINQGKMKKIVDQRNIQDIIKKICKEYKKITKTKTDFKKKFLYWHKFHFCDFDNFICSGCYCFSIKLWQIVFKE